MTDHSSDHGAHRPEGDHGNRATSPVSARPAADPDSQSGHPSGGHASDGDTSGGHASGGHRAGSHASGGAASDGHGSGGHWSGGHASGGHASGGHVPGGRDHGNMVADYRRRFWVSLVLTVPVVVLSPMVRSLVGANGMAPLMPNEEWIAMALSTAIYFYGGWPFLVGAVGEIKALRPGMMTLVALAIGAVFMAASTIIVAFNAQLLRRSGKVV